MIHTRSVLLAGLSVLLAGFLSAFLSVAPAMAQVAATTEMAPPAGELKLPAGAPQDVPVITTVKSTTTAPETSSGPTGDPCPTLKSAIDNEPDDLAKVQQDIDRFTLCVQRAQLLERLNESAIKSVASTDAALGFGNSGLGMGGVLPTGMPPLPAGALGGIDVAPAATAPVTTTVETAAPEVETPPAPEPAWQIREIFGSSVDMQARLLSPEGDELKVKKGMKLPDASIVTEITPSGVSIRGNKGVKSLEWAAGS